MAFSDTDRSGGPQAPRSVSVFDDLLAAGLAVRSSQPRCLIALAGAPASGKSTLAPRLSQAMTARGRSTQVVPMDGFHLDDSLLGPRGLLPRKGAPDTFDFRGFQRFLTDLATGGDIVHPMFDRSREIAIAQGALVPASCDTVIVEGNYLLLDAPGWRDLRALWDLAIFLPVPTEVLEQRLIARWRGFGLTQTAASEKARGNDIPNGVTVTSALLPPDIFYEDTDR